MPTPLFFFCYRIFAGTGCLPILGRLLISLSSNKMNACQCWRQNHAWESPAWRHRSNMPANRTKTTEMAAIILNAASENKKISYLRRFHHKFSILKLPQMAPRIITYLEQSTALRHRLKPCGYQDICRKTNKLMDKALCYRRCAVAPNPR